MSAKLHTSRIRLIMIQPRRRMRRLSKFTNGYAPETSPQLTTRDHSLPQCLGRTVMILRKWEDTSLTSVWKCKRRKQGRLTVAILLRCCKKLFGSILVAMSLQMILTISVTVECEAWGNFCKINSELAS